jgi:hypothetical protein
LTLNARPRLARETPGKFGGEFADGDAAGRERVIGGDGFLRRDGEKTVGDAPADVLRELLLKIAVEIGNAAGEGLPVVMGRKRASVHYWDTDIR